MSHIECHPMVSLLGTAVLLLWATRLADSQEFYRTFMSKISDKMGLQVCGSTYTDRHLRHMYLSRSVHRR